MTSVQEVPMKIALVRSGEVVEVRRRRLVNPSYEVVEKVASEVAKGKYRLQYTDEDGDVVTMSSQEEWEECLASWDAAHPLKLRIELRGPRGVGRRSCRSGSRSRSVSPHRRCHSRSRSVSSGCKHLGRRSLSPACRRKSPSSRHMPRGFPCGRTHSPQRFQAWLAKMEAAAKAYRCTPVECDAPVEQPKASETARAAHPFLLRGFPFGAQGMNGHGKGEPVQHDSTATADVEKATKCEAAQAQHPLHLFRDLLDAFAGKGMHGHGKGFKGAHGHGGKGCKGMQEHAGHRRMHKHADDAEKATERSPMPSSDEGCEAAQAQHPFHLFKDLLGAFAGKGMHGHGKGFKGAHGHGGKGCKGMQEHAGHRRMHGLRTVNSELIGQKCANCEFQTTGVLDSCCCWACKLGKAHHGMCCQQLSFGKEEKAAATTEETAEAPVACSSEAVEDEVQVQAEPCSAEQNDGDDAKVAAQSPSACSSEAVESHDDGWVHAEVGSTEQVQDEAKTAVEEEQPNTAEEEFPGFPVPFACQIAQLEGMGFAVTPQIVENLAASNGDVAVVIAGLFAQ